MHIKGKNLSLLISLLFVMSGNLSSQNYRDQILLIRLQPNFSLVYGSVYDYSGDKLSRANISIFDPATFTITETIPIDDAGDYLFTIKRGRTLGFLIEKEGYFPFYQEFTIEADANDHIEMPLHLPDGIRKDYTIIYSPEGHIPSNVEIVEEMISLLLNQPELSLWMPDQENPLGKSRIAFLDSLIQSRGIEPYRLISGSIPGNRDQIVELNFETDPDAEEIKSWNTTPGPSSAEDFKWTLQFSASKSKLSERDLKGLKNVSVFQGKDGFFRYTYGKYATRQEANRDIQTLKDKGFNQAFPKLIGNLKKL